MSIDQDDCCATGDTPRNGYDLIVVGAGSAGFSAAITAAEQGAQVALLGHGTIGGTCVNVGCVPSKAMLRTVEVLHQSSAASRFAGIRSESAVTDWQAAVRQKDDLVDELRQAKYLDLLPEYNGVAYLEGQAQLANRGVTLNGEAVEADRTIIATGSKPMIPDIRGLEEVPYLTSTEALDLKELPKSLIVLGGGYIGCELAQMFARAGAAVTILCRRRLLPDGEPEISELLESSFADEGITVRNGVTYEKIERTAGGVAVIVDGTGELDRIQAEHVLIAAGRIPNTTGLGLTEMGVEQLQNGGVKVDSRMRTSKPGVYAAGDVTGDDQFVYMAAYGAKIASLNAMNGDSREYDNSSMPAVVFTDPQVATVGLTESKAAAEGYDVKTSVFPLNQLPRALAARDTRGLIKLVADRSSDKLLGAHIIAPEGADSIQTAVLAIKHGLTVAHLAETVFPYLTTVEGLKLAAQTFDRDVTKLSCCAG